MTSLLKSTRGSQAASGDTPSGQRRKVQSNDSEMRDAPAWPGTSAQNDNKLQGGRLEEGGVASSGGTGLASGASAEAKTHGGAGVSSTVVENDLQELMK